MMSMYAMFLALLGPTPTGDALMAIGVLRGLGVPDRQIAGD
jgi:hypothetical protein